MQVLDALSQATHATGRALAVFASDVGRGMRRVGQNTLALVGLAALAVAGVAITHTDARQQAERQALDWLQGRHEQRELATGNLLSAVASPDAVARATATSLSELTRPQAALAIWIARRYKVAPEPVGALVQEAWVMGGRAGLDPTLILAIVAVESSFNPFAQSPVGAQGLMQVMTRVHDDKYEAFGGTRAAFDPISNLRVGVQVLKECIARAGSVSEGLRFYVGAALREDDGGYAARVLAEQGHMRNVAAGRQVALNAANTPAAVAPAASSAEVQVVAQATL
jgi:hypothetical protein